MKSIFLLRLILLITLLFRDRDLWAQATDRKKLFPIGGEISSSVNEVIKRNISLIQKNSKDPKFLDIEKEIISPPLFGNEKKTDFLNMLASSAQKEEKSNDEESFHLDIVIFNKGENVNLLTKYELQSLNDEEERLDCDKDCKIYISRSSGIKRFKLLSQKTFPTSFEVGLDDKSNVFLTTFENDYFIKNYLGEFSNFDLRDLSFLLIKNDMSILDTEIDKKYLKRIILDENFNIVPEGIGAYNLYIGIAPGLVNLLSKNKRGLLYRPVFLTRGELLVLENQLDVFDSKNVDLYQMGALATIPSPLNLYEDSIGNLSNETKGNRIGPNNFQFNNVVINPSGKYFFEIKERDINYIIGTDFLSPIVIPDKDLQTLIENRIGAQTNDPDFCITQLNFSKRIRSLKYSSEDELGPGDIIALSLSEEGDISDDQHEGARKIFFHSYKYEGIYYKIIFEDGSRYENETFCSPSNRVVEQI